MERVKTMCKRLPMVCIFLLPFLLLHILSSTVLRDVYLFEWMRRENYLFVWIIVAVVALFGKYYAAGIITGGYIVGIIVGQVLGDFINTQTIKKITDDMPYEQVDSLMSHYGFQIWAVVFLISIIVACIVQALQHKSGVIQ